MEIVSLIGKSVFDIFGFKVSELVASATSPHAGIASQRYLNNVRYQNIFYSIMQLIDAFLTVLCTPPWGTESL